MHLNLSADEVLTTTRAVRKRLDLSRPVDHADIRDCLDIALQAPTGSNRQIWHFVVVTDAAKIAKLGELYRRAMVIAKQQVAVLGRIEHGRLLLDLRGVPSTVDDQLCAAILAAT